MEVILLKNSLLLELALPFKMEGNDFQVEIQAFNGLIKWAENFDSVTVCAPVIVNEERVSSSVVWKSFSELPQDLNIRFVPLPQGYSVTNYLKYRRSVRRLFSELIATHEFLCFSNVGTLGCWGNIAVDEAIQNKRKYSLWFDWVVHEMYKGNVVGIKKKLKANFDYNYSKHTTLKAIKKCTLGLFHGKTVYDAYKTYCTNPQLVHDVHISRSDAISDVEFASKVARAAQNNSLKVGYLGRLHPMKGPFDWIDIAEACVKKLGCRMDFTWLGDGELLEEAKLKVSEKGIGHHVKFLGFESSRDEILKYLRELDVFLFCHNTPESPRCLIESLISGTPIVGYHSAYAEDLVSTTGGGKFYEVGDTTRVAEFLCELAGNRNKLALLTSCTEGNRRIYNDTAVFKHRSDLIKQYL